MLSCRHLVTVCGSPTAGALRGRLVSCGAGQPAPGCCLSQALALLIEARAPGSGSRGACCAQAGMKCQTQRLRRHYAKITQKLRNHYAGITQRLRRHYADITQSLRSHYAVITQSLRRHYAILLRSITQFITQFITQIHYANPLRN